jgi:two-component system, cell cycle sensor histidine kinase and response regulator CckA
MLTENFMKSSIGSENRLAVLRIVGAYIFFGTLWIYLSDTILGWIIHDRALMTQIAVFKGTLFIVLTAILLYYLISRHVLKFIMTEDQLKESEERFRYVLENVQVAVWSADQSGQFNFLSPIIADIYGRPLSEMMANPSFWIDTAHPEDQATVRASNDALFRDCHVELEYRIVLPDGTVRWISDRKILFQDEHGESSRMAGIISDITDRKKNEEALQRSEAHYRLVVENINDIIWTFDLSSMSYTFVSPSAQRILGYSNETVAKDLDVIFTPETKQRVLKVFGKVMEGKAGGESIVMDAEHRRKDGSLIWMEISASPLKDSLGNIIGFLGVTRDITERKLAEEALSLSQLRLRLFIDANSDFLFLKDSDLKYQMVNAANAAFLKREEAEILGKKDNDLMSEQAARAFQESDLQAIRQKRTIIGIESLGNKVYETHKFPVILKGDVVGVAGIIRDITERKALEAQLQQAQKMESIGTLAGGIAHDFNNLLMGILGNASLILMQLDKSHPVFDRLKNIEDYVKRGSDLTKQLLGFARSGKYEARPTNLAEFIRESSELFGRTKKEIRIYHKVQEELWVVEVDRGQMDQVLLNLYLNAWQAMPGGGELYLTAENVSLDKVDASPYSYDIKPGNYVKVTVTDTGIGMNEAIKARIFEPFFTTKEKGRGTGLGLASAYGIIKNHGGFIHVESKEGYGTSFMIYLPASNKVVENNHKTEDKLQKGQETVLLIDDEKMILDVGANMLEVLGYRVMIATGGKQGLKVYEQNKDAIDIVILDMIMPEIGGKETFDTMLQINPSVKVLLSSGYSLDGQAKDIMQGGCKGFIQKPFTMAELSKKIREIMDDR